MKVHVDNRQFDTVNELMTALAKLKAVAVNHGVHPDNVDDIDIVTGRSEGGGRLWACLLRDDDDAPHDPYWTISIERRFA